MKDWLFSDAGDNSFWLARIEVLRDGREEYLCGDCDGLLESHIVVFLLQRKNHLEQLHVQSAVSVAH